MTRPRPGIGSELLPVFLVLVCLAGTFSLVVTMHRRVATTRKETVAPALALAPPLSPVPAVPSSKPEVPAPTPPPVPTPPSPPPEDPTEKALAKLKVAQAEQVLEAQMADKKAEALESARQATVADMERWKRREMLIRTQIDSLTEQATRLEAQFDEVALERDVLTRERDAAKAALAKARARSSFAVLPNKAANGTWRRPIIIECKNGMAILQPHGPSFSMVDLSGLFGPTSSPIVAAVAREVVRVQSATSPDGAPTVPYIFFLIRPDGIRPYYNARGHLEALGIAFGYELVDQDMEIDFPDLDNLEEWDGSDNGNGSGIAATRPSQPVNGSAPSAADTTPRNRGGRASDDPAETFVWPARPTGSGSVHGGGPAVLPSRTGVGSGGPGGPGEPPMGGDPSTPARRNGLGRGGNGVDPLPPIDPDSPFGVPGPVGSGLAAGSSPGSGLPGLPSGHPAGGDQPQLGQGGGPGGLPLGNPGGVVSQPGQGSGSNGLAQGNAGNGAATQPGQGSGFKGGSTGNPTGGVATQPGQGPRLVLVNPDGMPSFDNPDASGSGGGPSRPATNPNPNPNQGGWRAVGRDPNSAQGNGTGAQSGPSSSPNLSGQSVADAPGSPTAGQSGGGNGNVDPRQEATPIMSGSESSNPNRGPYLSSLGTGSFAPRQGQGSPPSSVGTSDPPPKAGSLPSSSGVENTTPDQVTPPSTTGSGDVDPKQGPPQVTPGSGSFNPNQGTPPPLSQLASLAGATGTASLSGGSGLSSPPQSPNNPGVPVPLTLPSLDLDPDSSKGERDPKAVPSLPKSRSRPDRKPLTIEVPFEMVVACGPDGVVIHPGGYRLSSKALKGKEDLLLKDLKKIVQARRQVDPMIHPRPSIRFLVEPGGAGTYQDARRQTLMSGLDWPIALQVSDSNILDNFATKESW